MVLVDKIKYLCEVEKFELSLHPVRLGGGIGRHAGLKIPWPEMAVRVRFPSEAHQSLLEEILRGIFVWLHLFFQAKPVADSVEKRAADSGDTFRYRSGFCDCGVFL